MSEVWNKDGYKSYKLNQKGKKDLILWHPSLELVIRSKCQHLTNEQI